MTMKQFIKENKAELDKYIKIQVGQDVRINNEERRLWILNDYTLYQWAQRSGVNLD